MTGLKTFVPIPPLDYILLFCESRVPPLRRHVKIDAHLLQGGLPTPETAALTRRTVATWPLVDEDTISDVPPTGVTSDRPNMCPTLADVAVPWPSRVALSLWVARPLVDEDVIGDVPSMGVASDGPNMRPTSTDVAASRPLTDKDAISDVPPVGVASDGVDTRPPSADVTAPRPWADMNTLRHTPSAWTVPNRVDMRPTLADMAVSRPWRTV